MHFDFAQTDPQDIAAMARHGDKEAVNVLWLSVIDQVDRIVGLFTRRYQWIVHDDLRQEILCGFPKILARYDPKKGTIWDKYCYFSFYRACQDALRREDPLGIKFPQKKQYPAFVSLENIHSNRLALESTILEGICRIDRGENPVIEQQPLNRGRKRNSYSLHRWQYHGDMPLNKE